MRNLGKAYTVSYIDTDIHIFIHCTFTVARTLLPFDEYLQSLTITQYEKYSQEYEEAKACQPEGNLAKKDEMQKNTQEYNEYESSQQKIGNRDESIQKDKSLAQGGSIAKGRENYSSTTF